MDSTVPRNSTIGQSNQYIYQLYPIYLFIKFHPSFSDIFHLLSHFKFSCCMVFILLFNIPCKYITFSHIDVACFSLSRFVSNILFFILNIIWPVIRLAIFHSSYVSSYVIIWLNPGVFIRHCFSTVFPATDFRIEFFIPDHNFSTCGFSLIASYLLENCSRLLDSLNFSMYLVCLSFLF